MRSELLLKWVASGLIAAVLVSTLWMAHAVRPDQSGPSLMFAQVAAPAAAASAPVISTR